MKTDIENTLTLRKYAKETEIHKDFGQSYVFFDLSPFPIVSEALKMMQKCTPGLL